MNKKRNDNRSAERGGRASTRNRSNDRAGRRTTELKLHIQFLSNSPDIHDELAIWRTFLANEIAAALSDT
jgi:hypothetical protein